MDIKNIIENSVAVKQKLLTDEYVKSIEEIGKQIVSALKDGNTIITAGNGGSAADAQHFSAELTGKFEIERKGFSSVCLNTNVSNITAIANDYSYADIFSRQLAAQGSNGDVFVAISTSGNSKNLIVASEYARENGIKTFGLLGNNGGNLLELCDQSVVVPSNSTARIQESHIMIIHVICKMIDEAYR